MWADTAALDLCCHIWCVETGEGSATAPLPLIQLSIHVQNLLSLSYGKNSGFGASLQADKYLSYLFYVLDNKIMVSFGRICIIA